MAPNERGGFGHSNQHATSNPDEDTANAARQSTTRWLRFGSHRSRSCFDVLRASFEDSAQQILYVRRPFWSRPTSLCGSRLSRSDRTELMKTFVIKKMDNICNFREQRVLYYNEHRQAATILLTEISGGGSCWHFWTRRNRIYQNEVCLGHRSSRYCLVGIKSFSSIPTQ